jgi:uroporphyrinogen-III synthase
MRAPLVLLTGPVESGGGLASVLKGLGMAVARVPTVAIEPAAPGGRLYRIVGALPDYDWVVTTSANAVVALVAALERELPGAPLPSRPPRWAAVGPATADALAARHVPVEVIPSRVGGAALVDAIVALGGIRGARILLPRSDRAEDAVPGKLRLAGARVDVVAAYRTIEAPDGSRESFAAALDDPALAAVVVASGSAVRGAARLAADTGRLARLRATAMVSIGPSTSAAARDFGLEPAAEAAAPTPLALAAAVSSILARQPRLDATEVEASR